MANNSTKNVGHAGVLSTNELGVNFQKVGGKVNRTGKAFAGDLVDFTYDKDGKKLYNPELAGKTRTMHRMHAETLQTKKKGVYKEKPVEA